MKSVNINFIPVTTYRAPLFLIMIMVVSGFSILPASGQNPWHEESKPLIDDVTQDPSEENSWRGNTDTSSKGVIDESKYPPFDEDKTLGTNLPVVPPDGVTTQYASPPTAQNTFRYPESQAYGQMPVYPGSNQRNMSGYYGNSQYPQYRPGYQSGYPGYQRRYGPGYGSMGGFPFGGGNGSGFPFGGGNGWSPFSNSGFW